MLLQTKSWVRASFIVLDRIWLCKIIFCAVLRSGKAFASRTYFGAYGLKFLALLSISFFMNYSVAYSENGPIKTHEIIDLNSSDNYDYNIFKNNNGYDYNKKNDEYLPSVKEAASILSMPSNSIEGIWNISVYQQANSSMSRVSVQASDIQGTLTATSLALGNLTQITLPEAQISNINIQQITSGEVTASVGVYVRNVSGRSTIMATSIGNSVALDSNGKLSSVNASIVQENNAEIRSRVYTNADIQSGQISQTAVSIGNNVSISGMRR